MATTKERTIFPSSPSTIVMNIHVRWNIFCLHASQNKSESTDALIRSNYSDQIDEGKDEFLPSKFSNVSVNNDWDDLTKRKKRSEDDFYQSSLNFHDLTSFEENSLCQQYKQLTMCCVNLEIDLFISSLWCLCTYTELYWVMDGGRN